MAKDKSYYSKLGQKDEQSSGSAPDEASSNAPEAAEPDPEPTPEPAPEPDPEPPPAPPELATPEDAKPSAPPVHHSWCFC